MRFADEESVDAWFAEEKEKLDEAFSKAAEGGSDRAREKQKYDAAMKRLILDYQAACSKVVEAGKKIVSPENAKKIKEKKDGDRARAKERLKKKLADFWFKLTYKNK